jgi:hypothetical protein
MFENFGQEQASSEGRGRRGASALLSLAVFGLIAVGVGGAMTTHHLRAKQRREEAEVTFAALPQMKAPKPKLVAPPPKAAKNAAPKKMTQISKIPDKRPDEAEGDLAGTEDTGPIDGIVEAEVAAPVVARPVEAPPPVTGEPPPERRSEQVREEISRPVFVDGCRAPEIPDALHSQAETIRIEVRMLIGSDGRVKSTKVLHSHPLVPDALIMRCASAQVFQPARLPDGTAVAYPFRQRFVFKPEQA